MTSLIARIHQGRITEKKIYLKAGVKLFDASNKFTYDNHSSLTQPQFPDNEQN